MLSAHFNEAVILPQFFLFVFIFFYVMSHMYLEDQEDTEILNVIQHR